MPFPHNRRTHFVMTRAEADKATALGDHLCKQIDVWRASQGKAPYGNSNLRTNSLRVNPQLTGNGFSRRPQELAAISAALEDLTPDQRALVAEALGNSSHHDNTGDFISNEVQRRMAPLLQQIAKLNSMLETATDTRRLIDRQHRSPTPVAADLATNVSPGVHGLLGADWHADAVARRARADAYCANAVRANIVSANNDDDPAIRAMTGNGLTAALGGK